MTYDIADATKRAHATDEHEVRRILAEAHAEIERLRALISKAENVGQVDAERLSRSAMAFAKYHDEHASYGGASREFHELASSFLKTVASDVAIEIALLRASLDEAGTVIHGLYLRRGYPDDHPIVVELHQRAAELTKRGRKEASRVEEMRVRLTEERDAERALAAAAEAMADERGRMVAALREVLVGVDERCSPMGYVGKDGQYLKAVRFAVADTATIAAGYFSEEEAREMVREANSDGIDDGMSGLPSNPGAIVDEAIAARKAKVSK